MRFIHIDFENPENMLPDGYILGNQGEHNATVLVIIPPEDMRTDRDITSFRVAFELTNCRTVRSKSYDKTIEFSVPLFSQITSSETISVQLEGYDDNGELVVKSDKVTKLKFNPSVCGVEIPPSDSPDSMAAEVNLNTKFRENFGEDEKGILTYKGNPVGSGDIIKMHELTSGQFMIITNTPGIFSLCDSDNESPVGFEIVKIEVSFDDTAFIDIMRLFENEDMIPYFRANTHTYFSEDSEMTVWATFATSVGENPTWVQDVNNASRIRLYYKN